MAAFATAAVSADVENVLHYNVNLRKSASSGQAQFKKPADFVYPEIALYRRMEGCAVVSFEIVDGGLADHYKVIDVVPKGVGFDTATLLGLNGSVFEMPAKPGRYATRVDFELLQAWNDHEEDQDAVRPSRDCKAVPTYEELNPPTDAGK